MTTDDTSTEDTDGKPEWDDTPVALSLIGELIEAHPDWRLTTHQTPDDTRATMIEWADDNGEFASGLPGAFIKMISNFEEDDT